MFRNCLRLTVAAVVFAVLSVLATAADEKKNETPPGGAQVFTHPDKLTAKDKLTDGEKGTAIEIKEDTVLLWVDLMPDARFAHPTEYVLISASGTKVVKGSWWPVLNGKPLFRGDGSKVEPVKLGGGEKK